MNKIAFNTGTREKKKDFYNSVKLDSHQKQQPPKTTKVWLKALEGEKKTWDNFNINLALKYRKKNKTTEGTTIKNFK